MVAVNALLESGIVVRSGIACCAFDTHNNGGIGWTLLAFGGVEVEDGAVGAGLTCQRS